MKREALLQAFDPVKTLDDWHKRYPEISKLQVQAKLREMHEFLTTSTLVPSQEFAEHQLGLLIGPILHERDMIIKRLKKPSTVDEFWKPYEKSLPRTEVQRVLAEEAHEIETGKNYLISPATGISTINRKLADLNSRYLKLKAQAEQAEVEVSVESLVESEPSVRLYLATFSREFFRSAWFVGPAGAALFCNMCSYIVATSNPPRALEALHDPWIIVDVLLLSLISYGALRAKNRTVETLRQRTTATPSSSLRE